MSCDGLQSLLLTICDELVSAVVPNKGTSAFLREIQAYSQQAGHQAMLQDLLTDILWLLGNARRPDKEMFV